MSKKLTINECVAFASNKGGICLSKKYVNINKKMTWQCKNNHVWEARFSNIKQGHWCPYCNGYSNVSLKDCIEYAKSLGGKCLSKYYKNSYTKMKWQCKDKHTWESTFGSMKYKKHWCPYCSNNAKLTLNYCINIAKEKNGKCISTKYKNARDKMKWQCEHGHIWSAPLCSIKAGHWCMHCAGLIKLTLQDCIDLAKKRKGKCLSTEYYNNYSLMKWECECGHIWSNSFGHIKSGQWCPMCAKGKSQRKLFYILKKLLPNYTIK